MRRSAFFALLVSVAAISLAGPLAVSAGASTFEFPSSSSAVISDGAAPAGQVGYFWTQERGDKVSQTFGGPSHVDHVALTVQPGSNTLVPGQEVDWTLSINGTDVGSFVVPPATTAPILLERSFAPIAGPSYAVQIRVTNVVVSGGGATTLASTGGTGLHSLDLSNTAQPNTVLTGGPATTTTATSGDFTFTSPSPDAAGFQCSLDHASFVPCVSPRSYGALALGAHSFEVSAVDSAGNIDASPATWQWTVVASGSGESPKAPKARKCKKGFKKAKKHGKTVCVKKKHHKHKHQHH